MGAYSRVRHLGEYTTGYLGVLFSLPAMPKSYARRIVLHHGRFPVVIAEVLGQPTSCVKESICRRRTFIVRNFKKVSQSLLVSCLIRKRGLHDGGSVTFVLKPGTRQVDTGFKLRASLLPIFPTPKLRLQEKRARLCVACVRACTLRIVKQDIQSWRQTHA